MYVGLVHSPALPINPSALALLFVSCRSASSAEIGGTARGYRVTLPGWGSIYQPHWLLGALCDNNVFVLFLLSCLLPLLFCFVGQGWHP